MNHAIAALKWQLISHKRERQALKNLRRHAAEEQSERYEARLEIFDQTITEMEAELEQLEAYSKKLKAAKASAEARKKKKS